MREYQIEVTNELTEYLERLSYEIASRAEIVTMLIEKHKDDESVLESKAFKVYSEQLGALKAEFEMAKREFQDAVIPDAFKAHRYTWDLDYKSRIVTIKLLCDCEVIYG